MPKISKGDIVSDKEHVETTDTSYPVTFSGIYKTEEEDQQKKIARLNRLVLQDAKIRHDINNIVSVLELVLTDRDDSALVQDREEILLAVRQVRSLLQLSIATHTELPLCFQKVQIAALLKQALILFKDSFVLENQLENDELECDPVQISRVFVNLITNSIRHSKCREKPLIITVSSEGEHLAITFQDFGVGLPKDFQIESAHVSSHGFGIGLQVCAEIIAAHHGYIEAFNNPQGPGAVFKVTLPQQQPDQERK